jgi:hypothetical protein
MNATYFESKIYLQDLEGMCKKLLNDNRILGFPLGLYELDNLVLLFKQLTDDVDTAVLYPSKQEFSISNIDDVLKSKNQTHLYMISISKFIN